MSTRALLLDLYGHQAWADAEHWRALRAHPHALQDRALFERQHHIHAVQRAFLGVITGETAAQAEVDEFDAESLLAWARGYHEAAAGALDRLDEAALEREVTLPWFPEPPCRLSLAQALAQAATHSHYHRGQNATRLRELGGTPPLVDLVIWYWKGRPRPDWP